MNARFRHRGTTQLQSFSTSSSFRYSTLYASSHSPIQPRRPYRPEAPYFQPYNDRNASFSSERLLFSSDPRLPRCALSTARAIERSIHSQSLVYLKVQHTLTARLILVEKHIRLDQHSSYDFATTTSATTTATSTPSSNVTSYNAISSRSLQNPPLLQSPKMSWAGESISFALSRPLPSRLFTSSPSWSDSKRPG